jgi:hypothetical protein
MIKTYIYTYLGTNGTLTTPIHLPGIYSVRNVKLEAESPYKRLTKDGINFYSNTIVSEEDLDNWYEINFME